MTSSNFGNGGRGFYLNRRTALRGIVGSAALMASMPLVGCTKASAEPIAETAYGKVKGTSVNGIYTFKGIRYGAPTGGENRFMPPKEPAPWTGVLDALEYGNSAPQTNPNATGGGEGLFPPVGGEPKRTESEDCLFLNVWTPGLNDGGKRPVMVWLHGGGFSSGSGSKKIIAGENLARRGNTVVVTLNHRLNVFGFSHFADIGGPEYAMSGNVGMLDVIQALKWVRDNIDRFGGDSSRVMIFGESGGGQKVSMLLGCPLAKGLFHRAVIESGPGIQMLARDKATQVSEVLLQELGLPADNLSEIQNLPTEKILAAYFPTVAKTGGGAPGFLFNFSPVIDTEVLPHHPFSPTAAPYNADVPVIIGFNRTEMTLFADPGAFTLDDAEMLKRLTAIHGDAAPKIIETYKAKYPDLATPDLFIRIWTDYPTMLFSNLIAERRAAANQAPTYLYRFDWDSPADGGKYHTPHTMEIPFVFDNTQVMASMTGATPEAAALAAKVSSAWIAFATTGDPNRSEGALPTWKPYTPETRSTMLINNESMLADDPQKEERELFTQLYPNY